MLEYLSEAVISSTGLVWDFAGSGYVHKGKDLAFGEPFKILTLEEQYDQEIRAVAKEYRSARHSLLG